mmetsp:Transcript_14624/g.40480  ORF Transcript_14624/g.40480 Transcript_14624/m.40480 type:complete len:629 (+) Transcript_14624:69-1955(+)|eukprot:CAMPEP_0168763720 /NCGR_PEP_ID=MMETSP0724-20121128/24509_1 /TAXON_ID=265536 /ORGANISM="Amphiprora sp., Strain CCMP467" /LENGTH=628 /DNA_ID=CAMNT_0008812933 /DNA_START=33 /DNA_END=1919 /DNA_ORIENTATION=+
MDETKLDGWRQLLQMQNDAHAAKLANNTFESSKALKQSLKEIEETEDMVNDFITSSSNIEGWAEAHKAITEVWDSTEPQKVEVLLPKFVSSQAGKRQRVETLHFWIFRPVFQKYEATILEEETQGLYALTGPQGFGKSVFLHCLALKRAFCDNLVVWVAACPLTVVDMRRSLATAFYRGCQALGLDKIPYLKFSYSFVQSLQIIRGFAKEKGVQLLIIIDQLHRKLTYAEGFIGALTGLSSSDGEGHRVIVASSTSGTTDAVFPDFFIPLQVFDHFLSGSELEILRAHYQTSPNLGLVQGTTLSFLHATRILSQSEEMILENIAWNFVTKLEKQFRVESVAVSRKRKAEYMYVLHMAATNEKSPLMLFFNASLVDGDYFFVKCIGDLYSIFEFMQGFSEVVLTRLKAGAFYEECLQSVIESDHFGTITKGAQGSILEDAVSHLLRNKTHPVKFALTRLNGTLGLHQFGSFELGENRSVQSFTVVPDSGDLIWKPESGEWYVGIPPAGFTGIDFVAARTRVVGKATPTKTLEIFYIQSTVSTPQEHGVKKSDEQAKLRKSLKEAANVSDRNVRLFVTFLTPKRGSGYKTSNMEYSENESFHSSFQKLKGNDPLAEVVSKRCKKIWGSSN